MPPAVDVLPSHLAERLCSAQPLAVESSGAFVICWLRRALRAHENAALDVARHLAHALDRPLFVLATLEEAQPFACDRFHLFALQSLRDLGHDLNEMGIAWAAHVEREGHRDPIWPVLMGDAAIVVTDEIPVEPWRTQAAAVAALGPLWTVDAACVVPMTLSPQAPERAFVFRDALRGARQERLVRPWPSVDVPGTSRLPALPFTPVPVDALDDQALADLVGTCAIDHSVAPVPSLTGGTRAGRARWARFREEALAAYADRRNDALDRDGVSGLSPWLAHGCLAATELAREAAATGGRGADKYLDELMIWREVAWHFCYRTQPVETPDAIPAWARETLHQHESDPRPMLPDAECLERGRTGDRLWDGAARSLRVHGALHNNVRMTWGKALLPWTPDARTALLRLVDLNHRFALDGRDPASLGGILWCLGLFDRPFTPEQPVFGCVRARDTATHARRLDATAWERQTHAPALRQTPRVLIVGGGVAGLACARTLVDHAVEVTVLDKGRRPGGRASTRETPEGPFDHGAQFFTAHGPHLQRHADAWRQRGWLVSAPQPSAASCPSQPGTPATTGPPRLRARPGMQALAAQLANDLPDVRCSTRVDRLVHDTDGWRVSVGDGVGDDRWDLAVLTVPAPQATALLPADTDPAILDALRTVAMDPCWALMLVLPRDTPDPAAPAVLEPRDGVFARLARMPIEDGKHPSATQRWVLHASPHWSRRHLEMDARTVARTLWHEASKILQPWMKQSTEPLQAVAHRWRHARVATPLGCPFLRDSARGLWLAGDWCHGARIEAAWDSGVAAAGDILRRAWARELTQRGSPG